MSLQIKLGWKSIFYIKLLFNTMLTIQQVAFSQKYTNKVLWQPFNFYLATHLNLHWQTAVRCLNLIHYFSSFGKCLVLFARDSIMLRIKACSLRHYWGIIKIVILHVDDKFFSWIKHDALPNYCHYLVFNSIIIGFSVCQVSLFVQHHELLCFDFVFAVEGQRFSTAWRWLTLGVRDWKDVILFQITLSSPMPGAT